MNLIEIKIKLIKFGVSENDFNKLFKVRETILYHLFMGWLNRTFSLECLIMVSNMFSLKLFLKQWWRFCNLPILGNVDLLKYWVGYALDIIKWGKELLFINI